MTLDQGLHTQKHTGPKQEMEMSEVSLWGCSEQAAQPVQKERFQLSFKQDAYWSHVRDAIFFLFSKETQNPEYFPMQCYNL